MNGTIDKEVNILLAKCLRGIYRIFIRFKTNWNEY